MTARRGISGKGIAGLSLAAKVLLGVAVGLTGTTATAAGVVAILHGTDSVAVSRPARSNAPADTSSVTSAVTSVGSATSDDGTPDQGRSTPGATASAAASSRSGRSGRSGGSRGSGRDHATDNGVNGVNRVNASGPGAGNGSSRSASSGHHGSDGSGHHGSDN